jgi:endonuclease/exonuclease/phosphatase family metal-dependent hydrolase
MIIGCDDDDAEPTPTALTLVSYNGGLAVGFVEASESRAPLTIDAVVGLGADILCVQEFWLPEHVAALQEAASAYPSQIFVEDDPGTLNESACMMGDADALETCARAAGCDMVCSDDVIACGLVNCGAEVQALQMASPDCYACIGANAGKSLDGILSACTEPSSSYNYNGAFGIGLLSKHPIAAQEITVFESNLNRRAVIYAEVTTPLGPIHTLCTHLSAVFTDIPHPNPMSSWEEEQAVQIDQLIAIADQKAPGGQVILMGDMNTGPAGPGYSAEVVENYTKFETAGFTNPYTATPGHLCTFCADNPIVAKGNPDDDASVVIDHLLLRGVSATPSGAKRVLDTGIRAEKCGEEIDSAYSDHYGVQITLSQ